MKRQRTSPLQLLTAGALLVLAFAVGPAAAGGPAPNVAATAMATPETTAVVGEAQQPACLNPYLPCGNLEITRLISGVVLSGAYRVRPDLTYEPVLVDRVDVATSPFPLTLTYHLRPGAVWSDGVPVTSGDLLFTLEALQNPANEVVNRAGYELITSATLLDSKTARLGFSQPYHGWKRLFPHILPKHVLTGLDFDTTLSTSIPVASGPFTFESWQNGVQISLVRNENWSGPHLARSSRVIFRFILDTNSRFQALANAELTLLRSEPQLQLASLPPAIVVDWIPGPFIEHLDLNSDSPMLAHAWFRQALAYAIDRDAAVDAAFAGLNPVLGPGLDAHESLVFLSQDDDYVPHFDGYAYAPASVSQIMLAHDCVMGVDGIWSCDGTRASVRFAITTGNTLRATVQNTFIANASAAGIELVPDNATAQILFGTRLPAGDFDLIMFGSVMNADPALDGVRAKYGCGGGANFMSYCSSELDALLDAADAETNDAARAALFNDVDGILAEDVPSMPLFQRPSFLAHWPAIAGVVNNAGPQGFTWNIEEWCFQGGPFSISNASPPNGVTGTLYSFHFEPVGGAPPFAFALAGGTLPPGLAIAPNGTLHGTPTTPGTFAFDVRAGQCGGDPDAERAFTVTIREALAITTSGLASGTVGVPYAATLGATGAGGVALGWSVSGGSLPAGLTLSPSGTISGTPAAPGDFAVAVKVSDTDGFVPDRSATRLFTLAVRAALAATAPTNQPTGIVGKPYTGGSPTATGGLAPYQWSLAAGTIAPGLSVNPATGALGGTPTTAGTFAYTLGVADAEGRTANVGLSVTVLAALVATAPTNQPIGIVGRPYTGGSLTVTGGLAPYQWSLATGTIAPRLSVNPATGALGGTPTRAGTFAYMLGVADAEGRTANVGLSVTVVGALDVVTSRLPKAKVGRAYRAKLVSRGGQPPMTWRIAKRKLPAGLRLNPSTGVLRGKPRAKGTFKFTVTVSDVLGQKSSQALKLNVRR